MRNLNNTYTTADLTLLMQYNHQSSQIVDTSFIRALIGDGYVSHARKTYGILDYKKTVLFPCQ